jgi:hypothetical protein
MPLRGLFVDLFDRMPYLLVAVSQEDANRIEEAAEDGAIDVPNVTVLHVCAYPETPQTEDVQSLYTELWNDPEFSLNGQEVVLIEPGEEMRKTIIRTLRERGVTDEKGSEDLAVRRDEQRIIH